MYTSGNDDGHDAVGRESAHDTSSALLNGVTTRTAAKTAAQGVRTCAATRAAASLTSDSPAPSVATRATPANTTSSAHQGRAATRAAPRAITDWTNRALIDPGLQHRHISGSERQDAVEPAASSFANFEPNPESQQRDTAAVQDFVRNRESVTPYRSLDPPAAARDAPPPPAAVLGDAAQHSRAPPGARAGQDDPEAARSQLPPCGLGPPFQRDDPAPLVDRANNARYIVEAILQHDDTRAAPPQVRGVHHRDGEVPPHLEYLMHWLGPMPDSWEPHAVLVADVPDCVAAYEASLASAAGSPCGAVAHRA
ncbi:hypothetical protein PC112_g19147 [Phytophthora cactorum]|nr:hypothetical protein PC112_g19147 [Phytophthora cactorum]